MTLTKNNYAKKLNYNSLQESWKNYDKNIILDYTK